MAKTIYGIRFKPELHSAFKKLAKTQGYTITGAFEKYITLCIAANKIIFPVQQRQQDLELEAQVLVDWLGKGRRYYSSPEGEELSIEGQLLKLIHQFDDAELKRLIVETLKSSTIEQ